MTKRKLIVATSLIMVLLMSCNLPKKVDKPETPTFAAPVPSDAPGSLKVVFGEPFILQLTEEKKFALLPDGSQVSLLVIRESRCPEDVTCVWAGNADVQLSLAAPNKEPEIVYLRIGPSLNDQVISNTLAWNGLVITFVDLKPLPNTKALIKLEQMQVTLQVDKK